MAPRKGGVKKAVARKRRNRRSPVTVTNEYDSSDGDQDDGVGYFEAHDGACKTSRETLQDLELQYPGILSHEDPNGAEKYQTRSSYMQWTRNWRIYLMAGANVLCYGLGSKFDLLTTYAERLADGFRARSEQGVVLEILGYLPTTTLKKSLVALLQDVFDVPEWFVTQWAVLDRGRGTRKSLSDFAGSIHWLLDNPEHTLNRTGQRVEADVARDRRFRLFLVVHNIDGENLRTPEVQEAFSKLASHQRVHLLASIDHINSPLLWNPATLARYAWVWQTVHTKQRYLKELQFAAAGDDPGNAASDMRIEGASMLLRSVPLKARGVFSILLDFQCKSMLSRSEKPAETRGTSGMTWNELYGICREKFFVSNPAGLRLILTEFKTHDLLLTQRARDSSETFWIPLSIAQLDMLSKRQELTNVEQ